MYNYIVETRTCDTSTYVYCCCSGQSVVSKPQDKMAKTALGDPATEVGQHTPEERAAGDRPGVRGRRWLGNGDQQLFVLLVNVAGRFAVCRTAACKPADGGHVVDGTASARYGGREIVRKTCGKISRPSRPYAFPWIVHNPPPTVPRDLLFRPWKRRPPDRVARAIISTTE